MSMPTQFSRIALLVTGEGEEQFLPRLFRSLMERRCVFLVRRRIKHLDPIRSPKRLKKMVGKGQIIPTEDEKIARVARDCLDPNRGGFDFIIIVDDLEHDRRDHADDVYQRYRTALDVILQPNGLDHRASVHFLVNMLEAYYFANAAAINAVLGTRLTDLDRDVETISHPKNELKALSPGFDEIEHGEQIMQRLDVRHVLSNPETCRSLRTLFGWCSKAIGRPFDETYRLLDGKYWEVTREQINKLPGPPVLDWGEE